MARTRRDYQRWARRGSTAQRGYGGPHARLRAQWKPRVDAGQAWCVKCGSWIQPGTPWDLDHTDDRAGWRGPAHRGCNRSDGQRKTTAILNARRGNRMRGTTRWMTSRQW